MKYQRPFLRPLNARSAKGGPQGCAPGSSALDNNSGCTTGSGVAAWGCRAGSGDGWGCYDGAAALFFGTGYCTGGPTPQTACDAGPSPATGIYCAGGSSPV